MKYWINSDGLEKVNASKLKKKLAFTFSNNKSPGQIDKNIEYRAEKMYKLF